MSRPLALVGCGVLRAEVEFLLRRNGWQAPTRWLESSLHNSFGRLHDALEAGLCAEEQAGRRAVVFYGACHPRLDALLEQHDARRTEGQNCIAMLLGHERFMDELAGGAYFLLEDWARTFEHTIGECFGSNCALVREIFHGSHTRLVALRTPCSGDFTEAAEAASRLVDLPLEWRDVDLAHLEVVLADALGGRASAREPS